jgi:dienelactone hydrolase
MRRWLGEVLLVAWLLAAGQRADATPAAADISRTLAMLFAGAAGAAGGDVNADGRATAADVGGVVLGLRSPTQPGPYGVGFQRLTFTKPSVTKPTEQRVLETDVWYPAPPGTGPISQQPGGVRNAPLADGVSHLPLLVFSHGSCGFPAQSIYLTPLIASYGFVVAAPPHPGNTTSELFTCMTPAALADSFVNRPADISFVIDELLALNADPTSFFYGTIDPSRIGMSGHSFGGLTTLLVAALDPRVIAGLALAPVSQPIQDEVARIRVPMMIQVGTLDDLLADGELAYDLLQPERDLVEIERMPHSPFSDFCLECGPETISTEVAHLYVLRYAVPFVLRWVAGDTRFGAFLDPGATPPGVAYTRDSDRSQPAAAAN